MKMFIFKINLNGTFTGEEQLLKKTNQHDFYYQCSKDGPDHLLGKLIIRGGGDETFPPTNKK